MKKQKVIISVSIAIILLCLLYFFVPELLVGIVCLFSFLYLCGSFGFLLGTPLIIFFSKDQNQIDKAKKQFINNLLIFLASCSLFFLSVLWELYLLLHDITV